jgi:hypothetical protein
MISWLAATIAGCVSDPRTGSGEAILPRTGGWGRPRAWRLVPKGGIFYARPRLLLGPIVGFDSTRHF